jgi:hypothetical protein
MSCVSDFFDFVIVRDDDWAISFIAIFVIVIVDID